MARILKSRFGTFLDLDGNVGSRGGNARPDVGAVQFALLLLTSGSLTPSGLQGGSFSVPGQDPIAVDGYYGPQTAAYIQAYQAFRGHVPSPNGATMPNPDGNLGSFRRTTWNLGVMQSDVESGGGSFLDQIANDPRSPMFLKQSFFA